MAVHTTLYLTCDHEEGCDMTVDSYTAQEYTEQGLQAHAEAHGWRTDIYGLNLCPGHARVPAIA